MSSEKQTKIKPRKKSLSPANNLFNRGEIKISSPIKQETLDLNELLLPDITSRPSSPVATKSSPKNKKNIEDISKETFENILHNYNYNIIALSGKDKSNIEYIICSDPIGNTVYIDIANEEDNIIESSSFNIIEYSSCLEKDVNLENSTYEEYKNIVKRDVFGIVIHSDNFLIFIKQNNVGELDISFNRLREQRNKRFHVYPIIQFSDAIADVVDDYGNPLTFLDSAEQTKCVVEIINERMKDDVMDNYSKLVDSLNDFLANTKKIKKNYENEYKLKKSEIRKYEEECFGLCEKYQNSEEGLTEEEVEEYEDSKFSSYKEKCNMHHKNSTFLDIKHLFPMIRDINDRLNEICKNIGTDKDLEKKITY
jgi:hypothetical protein